MKKDILLPADQMFISVDELKKNGLTYYKINRFVDEGKLIKLNKRYYENTAYAGEISDFCYAAAYVPQGVVCLMSAAVYYELTNSRLDKIDIAIPRKSRVSTMPQWPQLEVHYFTNERYGSGIKTVQEGGNRFRIYDMEKTVADMVFYREQVGIGEMKEVLVNYLKRDDRNINRLMRYAQKLKCEAILGTYMEVLL